MTHAQVAGIVTFHPPLRRKRFKILHRAEKELQANIVGPVDDKQIHHRTLLAQRRAAGFHCNVLIAQFCGQVIQVALKLHLPADVFQFVVFRFVQCQPVMIIIHAVLPD